MLILLPIRRLEIGVLEVGWQLFIFGRLVDFLDELFIEAEPLVEPYLSGLLMVLSLSIAAVGVLALIDERDDRIDELQQLNDELLLKDELIDEAPVRITVADMTRGNEPLFLVNDAFTELTGYGRTETLGRNCRFLQGEESNQEAIDAMREATDANESVQVTLRNYRKDGTLFWNEVTLAPIAGPAGPGHYYVGFQQDATERKQYEQELEEQRDDLDLLNQMIQHDIRNDPLARRGVPRPAGGPR